METRRIENGSAPKVQPDEGTQRMLDFVASLQAPAAIQARVEKTVNVPTLHIGQPANESDATSYDASSKVARDFAEHRDAVVLIKTRLPDGSIASGTGFFVSKEGRIGTASHVVDQSSEFEITTADGRVFQAVGAGHRRSCDVGSLQVVNPPATGFPTLKLAESSRVEPGSQVTSIGHPLGFKDTFLSVGTVEGRSTQRQINCGPGAFGANPQRTMLSIKINVQPGNSGGPLLNEKGEVIGITNFGGFEGVQGDFAVVEDLKQILPNQQDERSYFLPERLHLGDDTLVPFATTAAGTACNWLGRIPQARLGSLPKVGGVFFALGGAHELVYDATFAKTAFTEGTVAERVTSAINLSADAGMVASGGMAFTPWRKYALPVGLSSAGVKLANNVLSIRKY